MQDRGPQLVGTCGALLALGIVAVGVRCYVRLAITKSFGYDDSLMLATLVRPLVLDHCGKASNQCQVFYSLFCAVVLVGVRHGTGQHQVDLTPSNFSIAMKVGFYSSPIITWH